MKGFVLSPVVVLVLVASSTAAAQTPPPPAASTAKPVDPPPTPPSDYAYAGSGRRDPFVSLLNRGETESLVAAARKRPEGVAGLMVNEIVVRGVLESQGGWVAMVGAPDGKTYTVRAGDRLMDGSVRSITPQVLILMQEVKDPLSVDKQREVRKYLRGGEEVQ
jgi:Tfp pilus assembly protein PilP